MKRIPQWVVQLADLHHVSRFLIVLAENDAQLVQVIPIRNTEMFSVTYRAPQQIEWH